MDRFWHWAVNQSTFWTFFNFFKCLTTIKDDEDEDEAFSIQLLKTSVGVISLLFRLLLLTLPDFNNSQSCDNFFVFLHSKLVLLHKLMMFLCALNLHIRNNFVKDFSHMKSSKTKHCKIHIIKTPQSSLNNDFIVLIYKQPLSQEICVCVCLCLRRGSKYWLTLNLICNRSLPLLPTLKSIQHATLLSDSRVGNWIDNVTKIADNDGMVFACHVLSFKSISFPIYHVRAYVSLRLPAVILKH